MSRGKITVYPLRMMMRPICLALSALSGNGRHSPGALAAITTLETAPSESCVGSWRLRSCGRSRLRVLGGTTPLIPAGPTC